MNAQHPPSAHDRKRDDMTTPASAEPTEARVELAKAGVVQADLDHAAATAVALASAEHIDDGYHVEIDGHRFDQPQWEAISRYTDGRLNAQRAEIVARYETVAHSLDAAAISYARDGHNDCSRLAQSSAILIREAAPK